jgi:hypothetical protein
MTHNELIGWFVQHVSYAPDHAARVMTRGETLGRSIATRMQFGGRLPDGLDACAAGLSLTVIQQVHAARAPLLRPQHTSNRRYTSVKPHC